MGNYILSIDQGTTSSRVIIFDSHGNIIYKANKSLELSYPKPGYVEFDASTVYEDVVELIVQALNEVNIDLKDIIGAGITNQRESAVLWDKRTGKPLCNAICWQSSQSDYICKSLKDSGYESIIKEKTGLIINPYFSASKIMWMLENVEGLREIMDAGNLMFGTIDSWLIYKLTGKHLTDVTNASRTLLFNINTMSWDEELLNIMGINKNILPGVIGCNETIGNIIEKRITELAKIELCAVAGDQQASLVGHTCLSKGDLKITYGTGSFMLLNTGSVREKSNSGLLTTVAYKIGDEIAYALEGSVFCAGAAFNFIKDNLDIIKSCDNSEFKMHTSNGVIFVPSLTGMGAPYWSSTARGAILGLSRGTSKEDIAFATVLGVAYMNYDVMNAMKNDASINVDLLSVDGGASVNMALMQAQADVTNAKVNVISTSEATSLGIFYLVGLNKGLFKDFSDVKKRYKKSKTYIPSGNEYEINYEKWKKAVKLVTEL